MWRYMSASVIGTAHQSNNTDCQDSHIIEQVTSSTGNYLLAIVADGAGSAVQGGQGAALACHGVASCLKQQLAANKPLNQALIAHALLLARTAIQQQAAANQLAMRDYATTVSGIVIAEQNALSFQIGDGAIIASINGYQGLIFEPDNGLYANMTYFLTDEDYASHLMIQAVGACIEEVMLFSDGLQRLALNLDAKTPFGPFFEPMLKALRQSNSPKNEQLNEHLAQFLASDLVNKRTDDDKTLVLATRKK